MVVSIKQKHAALKQKTDQLNLQIRQSALEAVPSTKYLGVHINNSLNWKKHIEEISKKISRSLGLFEVCKKIPTF